MIKNLKAIYGFDASMEKVRLVDEQMRITSSFFNIWVPSLMHGIIPSLEPVIEAVDKTMLMNSDNLFIGDEITLDGCILAKSIHPYRFRHDGWIPEFMTKTSTYATMDMVEGTMAEQAVAVTDGVTQPPGAPDAHVIVQPIKLTTSTMTDIKYKEITSDTMVHTNSTGVDYQELNRVYITKDAILYGNFLSGGDITEFVITAIDAVVPYYDETEDNNENNHTNGGEE